MHAALLNACQPPTAPPQPNVLYSGADDCTFKGWDCRAAAPTISWRAPPAAAGPSAGAGGGHAGNADEDEEEDDEDADMALFNNRREHEAGVCCVAPHPSAPHVVATGSYDERIRLWDMRKLSKPVVTSEVGARCRCKTDPRAAQGRAGAWI